MPDTPIESCDDDEKEQAEQPEEAKYLHTSGHGLVQVVRDSLRPGSYAEHLAGLAPFPTQTLDKAGVQGWAQLVPATLNEPQLLPPDQQNSMVQQMWALQKKMSDLDRISPVNKRSPRPQQETLNGGRPSGPAATPSNTCSPVCSRSIEMARSNETRRQ